jgi:hypothetical protein
MRVFWLLCSLVLLVLLTASDADATEASIATPTRLHATRPATDFSPTPLDVTTRDEAAVQRLYQAAYKLTPVPPGEVLFCPAQRSLNYTLDFFQGEVEVQQMHLNPTGCHILTIGSRGGDHRFTTPDFIALVARTIGIPLLIPT